ncbi:MAG: polyprenyl synthetase family protein [Anaerolineaceae bacterium]
MDNDTDLSQLQTGIENELAACIGTATNPLYAEYWAMFTYQLGWENSSQQTRGKRIRPVLVSLANYAFGGNWHSSLPAAASLELMHNFSLIHDDIQDKSTTRRGKPTVWVKWGEPLAINAGDAFLAASSLALARLHQNFEPEMITKAAKLIHNACLNLTLGQFLDISFESEDAVPLTNYFEMIKGKTCALLTTSLEVGGLLGGANEQQCSILHDCGITFGEAFQIQDDWLGIWGDDALTGKSNQSDLITRKKSFPILTGLAKKKSFYEQWEELPIITSSDIPTLVQKLIDDGVKSETETQISLLYQQTNALLESLQCTPDRLLPLQTYLQSLIKRVQ